MIGALNDNAMRSYNLVTERIVCPFQFVKISTLHQSLH